MRWRRAIGAALCLATSLALAQSAPRPGGARQQAEAELARAQAVRQRGTQSDVAAARAAYGAAIGSFRTAGDSCGLRRALVALAGFEHDEGNTPAQKAAAAAAVRTSCGGDLEQQALAERLLGSAYINAGDYAAGARETERAVALFGRAGDGPGESEALRNLGLAYEESGELGKALVTTRRALVGAERAGDARLLALIRNDMALIYSARGEFARAVTAYQRTLEALGTHPYPTAEAVAYINLGVAYGQLGDDDQAQAAYQKGETASTRAGCWSCLAEIEVDRGDDLLNAGDAAQAEPAYRRALALATAHQLLRQRAEALRGLGSVAMACGRWAEARALLESASAALRGTSEHLNEALMDIALGDLDDRQRSSVAAEGNYARALELARNAANETWQAAALASLARVEEESNALDRARRSIAAAVALIESERTQIDAPDLRTSYFATKRSYYGLYIDILMRLDHERPGRGYAGSALAVAERARARALQDELAARAIDLRQHVDPKLLAAESAAEDRLHALAWQLSRAAQADDAQRGALQHKIDEASHELDEARGRIRAADPRYAELVHPAVLRLDEIQHRLLDPGVSVLEYWLGERGSYLWVVTRNALRAYTLPDRVAIDAAVGDLRAKILAPATATVSFEQRTAFDQVASKTAVSSALRLANLVLPQQARSLLRPTIALVPDGGLERVPFALLLDRNGGAGAARGGDPFGTPIVYLPSIRTLRSLRALPRSTAPRRALAVFADPVFRADDARLSSSARPVSRRPLREAAIETGLMLRAAGQAGVADLPRLPYTRAEARAIEAFANRQDSWAALGFAANRQAVLGAQWRNWSVAHFATHALLNARHPDLSGIVLSLYDAHGRPEDGFLWEDDLYGLDMPVALVVLSVCDSAVGKDVGAEGPATLARALFYAGAHHVLATLWPVNDRASVAFMRSFYGALFGSGLSPEAALVAAQRELRQSARWHDPYYWAPYVLEGDWR